MAFKGAFWVAAIVVAARHMAHMRPRWWTNSIRRPAPMRTDCTNSLSAPRRRRRRRLRPRRSAGGAESDHSRSRARQARGFPDCDRGARPGAGLQQRHGARPRRWPDHEDRIPGGRRRKAGDLVAQIDPRPFQAALDQARAKKGRTRQISRTPNSISSAIRRWPSRIMRPSSSSTPKILVCAIDRRDRRRTRRGCGARCNSTTRRYTRRFPAASGCG